MTCACADGSRRWLGLLEPEPDIGQLVAGLLQQLSSRRVLANQLTGEKTTIYAISKNKKIKDDNLRNFQK